MFWSAAREAQLLTFLVMRGQWLRRIVPREAAWQQNSGRSRDGNDDGQAHGNLWFGPYRAAEKARVFAIELHWFWRFKLAARIIPDKKEAASAASIFNALCCSMGY